MMSARTVFAVLVIAAAVLYSYWRPCENSSSALSEEAVSSIVKAWDDLISSTSPSYSRVSFGFNACVDLIVSAVDVLTAAKVAAPRQAIDHAVLNDFDHLAETFAYFFAKGSAAERSFANASLFRILSSAAQQTGKHQSYIGGNAALMAQKIASLFPNIKVQLVGPVGPQLQRLLDQRIDVPASSRVPEDELHLIMEYGVNESWAGRSSPIATRFITSHDQRNSRAELADVFFAEISPPSSSSSSSPTSSATPSFGPDLVVFSGLHMLESQQDAAWLEDKVSRIASHLAAVPRSLPVHLELASMVNEAFLKSIANQIFERVSSIGLNEQELGFLMRALNAADVDLGPGRHPTVAGVVDALKYILRYAGGKSAASRLSRVHFHCLTFHVLAMKPAAWSNGAAAVAAGARIATTQACDSERVHHESVVLQVPRRLQLSRTMQPVDFNPSEPVIHWSEDGLDFAFSPVLVCKQPLKTVGLGDAISATGLLYSRYLW